METSTLRKSMPVSALFDPKIVVPAIGSAFVKLNPRTLMKNPVMFVLEVVTALTTVILVRDLVVGGGHIAVRVSDYSVAVVHRVVRQFRRSGGRGPRQGAGRHAAPSTHRDPGQASDRCRRLAELPAGAEHRPQGRRHRSRRSRRHDSVGWRGDRRHGLGQRGGDHRRIRAGHPRVRRRPLGGHRRHAGSFRLDPRAHYRGARFDIPRSHDPAGRGRRTAEDAE